MRRFAAVIVPCVLLCLAPVAGAQLLPAFATEWKTTKEVDIAAAILKDHEQRVRERYRIQQDLQQKIFELSQELTVNKGHGTDRSLEAYGPYISDGTPKRVSAPTVQSSGRVTITPASGGPAPPGQMPEMSFWMRVVLFVIPGATSTSASDEATGEIPLWDSGLLARSFEGFGTFDYDVSFSGPAFEYILSGADALGVRAEFTSTFDTAGVVADDVRFVLGTGGEPHADLPETTLSFVVTQVPEPSAAIALGGVLLAHRRRRATR